MTLETNRAIVLVRAHCDYIVCVSSLILAPALLHPSPWLRDGLILHHPLRSFVYVATVSLCGLTSLAALGLYSPLNPVSIVSKAVRLALGTLLAALSALLWNALSKYDNQTTGASSLLEILVFWTMAFGGLITLRGLAGFWRKAAQLPQRHTRNILIVGTNWRSIALADRLLKQSMPSVNLVGFVDEYWHQVDAPNFYKSLHLPQSMALIEILRSHAIDEVIVTLPMASSYAYIKQIIEWCRQQGIPVLCEGALFDLHTGNAQVEVMRRQLFFHLNPNYHVVANDFKRLIDLMVSVIALTALSPLLAIIALIIKVSSKGPALFTQERLGLNKRIFRIYKFRTMTTDAEARMFQVESLNQSGGPTFKLVNDPRITPAGKFLRKTSLDELPQLLNVLMGSMSLVGPRPLPLRDYRGFSDDWHRRRFSVKPGVTCLWQISGRSSIGFDQWMKLDLDYIDRWSIWLDLSILMKTVPAVIRGSGAM